MTSRCRHFLVRALSRWRSASTRAQVVIFDDDTRYESYQIHDGDRLKPLAAAALYWLCSCCSSGVREDIMDRYENAEASF